MKKLIISAVLLSLGAQAFAQDVLYQATIKKEEVPTVVIAAVERDYPDYVMEDFYALPLEYVDTDVYVDRNINSVADYDTFEIALSGKGEAFTATYDSSGKLLSTMQHGKNVTPPAAVRTAVAKAYPGWSLAKDTYNMTHYTGGKKRERYRIELTKGSEKMQVYTDAKGKILNTPKEHKLHKKM
ncbi:hypothetical protein [Flagellimonas beolgyonensis]|uniref:hypothetical protein n=1 Tax=Flagellimonas beolgyonensis TaxID=864064 RepID=UPI003D657599